MEEWRDIKGYEDIYQISSLGKVRSFDRIATFRGRWGTLVHKHIKGIIKSPNLDTKGYWYVGLYKEGKVHYFKIHQLIATAFIDNPYGYNEINHIDGNKQNNSIENLEWCTHAQNIQHAVRTGLLNPEDARKYHYRKVKQIDPKTNKVIRIWNTIIEAGKSLSHSKKPGNPIWCCLHGLRATNTAYGYKWEYAN